MNPFHFITMQAAQDALRDLGVQPLHSAAIVGRPKRRGVRMPTLVRIVVTICVIGGSLAIASPEALAIVGGAEDPSVLSPYVRLEIATFDAKWERIYEHRCSGTVIAPKWVLTAWHCMPMIEDVPYNACYRRRRGWNPYAVHGCTDGRSTLPACKMLQ